MDTMIRKGKTMFYGDHVFPHGISRSGYFNKRESDELIQYGATFEALCNGTLAPENDEEMEFIEAMNTDSESALYAAKLWKKYLLSVEKSRVRYGFSSSNGKVREQSGNDLSFA